LLSSISQKRALGIPEKRMALGKNESATGGLKFADGAPPALAVVPLTSKVCQSISLPS